MARLTNALVLLAAGLALAACSESNGADAPRATAEPRPVVVGVVRYAPRTPERSFVGVVRPRIESDLGFRVAGKVAERLVGQGDRVRRGQPLMKLDPTDFDLAREQAQAELRAATVNLDQAAAQERRTLELRRNGWTTDQTVERTLAATAEARARLDRARRQLDLAQNQASYAVLAADADGVVTATLAEPGQVVAAGVSVVRLARDGEREAVVALPEHLVERVRGGRAAVTLWSRPDRRYGARLRELAAAADPSTRTFQARFAILDADEAVAIGTTATVAVAEPESTPVARLPVAALFDQGRGASLFVVDPASGALTLVPVEVAGFEGRNVLVASGVAEGASVVVLGVQKLDPGQRVRVVESRS